MPENSSAIYIGFDAIMENERLPYIREEVNHAEEAFKDGSFLQGSPVMNYLREL